MLSSHLLWCMVYAVMTTNEASPAHFAKYYQIECKVICYSEGCVQDSGGGYYSCEDKLPLFM